MRLATIKYQGKEQVAVQVADGMITVESVGIHVNDMNELIQKYDDIKESIINGLGEAKAISKNQYELLAPIPVPSQDIICLGVNYREHIEETVDVLDFTKKTDAVYFSKRVNKANNPGGNIPVYDFVESLDYEVELGVILKKDALFVYVKLVDFTIVLKKMYLF